MKPPISYMTVVEPVREVSWQARTDFAPVQAYLANESVQPIQQDGYAHWLISAVDTTYKGIRFQELSFSVALEPDPADSDTPRYFLVHAFNSRAWFAWVERVMFGCPYYPAQVQFDHSSLQVMREGKRVWGWDAISTGVGSSTYASWEGEIHLPKDLNRSYKGGAFFYAHLEGETQEHQGQVSIHANETDDPFFSWLAFVHLQVERWYERPQGIHRKSRTYPRHSKTKP